MFTSSGRADRIMTLFIRSSTASSLCQISQFSYTSTIRRPLSSSIFFFHSFLSSSEAYAYENIKETVSKVYRAVPNRSFNEVFGTSGDSGSFLFDRFGQFGGLYFGGSTYGTGFFTGIEKIINAIKKLTNAPEVEFML
ncbi:hypothetical protein CIHG_03127 [Coccidioides immitis H538.4]|uniref:Uncharacterized protein n=3 Tax=Coccidioides immitis TaxID=5501 RepID=A0A0J8R1K1_COCIT|nr:hypothetical protein CIRG_00824 [Coccidioides immitis RMSCC 2394]KMU78200.1 hypothetical protein CISG_07040 [Coccidioides immitis RMSCC 3703]KMU85343.1 hypothetical protein CIHG_03127 [Coccidioides immitis H538.4]